MLKIREGLYTLKICPAGRAKNSALWTTKCLSKYSLRNVYHQRIFFPFGGIILQRDDCGICFVGLGEDLSSGQSLTCVKFLKLIDYFLNSFRFTEKSNSTGSSHMQQFSLLLTSPVRMVHLLILMNQCWYIINLSLHFIQISSLFYYCCFSVSQSHSGYHKTFKCHISLTPLSCDS